MTPDVITAWLNEPTALPDDAGIENTLRDWPWFVPARLMETARDQQQAPFSDTTLARLKLYSNDWLPAYSLLIREKDYQKPVAIEAANSAAAADDFEDVEDFEEIVHTPDSKVETQNIAADKDSEAQPFIQPFYTEDYFRHQGIEADAEEEKTPEAEVASQPQTLMVVMSFGEWLTHFKVKSQKEQEEAKEKSALRSMWQQEKLAAALDDEPEEIPEDVFEMAVSSITREGDIVSESLAQIYERQEKWSAAGEMYRKLALKYPAKSAYFVSRAEAAKKRLT